MRVFRKYRIYSCINHKILYQVVILKVGVRLVHALRGSAPGGLCKHMHKRVHLRVFVNFCHYLFVLHKYANTVNLTCEMIVYFILSVVI